MNEELKHYGTPRHSGRYPWGSGGDPYQRATGFRSHIQKLKSEGLSDVEIAKREGITTTQLRARMSLAKDEVRAAQRAQVIRLKDKGYSNVEIGKRMNLNESSVRSLLDPIIAERAKITKATANMLKENVDQKRFIDIGAGIENHIGVSRTKLNTAIAELQEQGYKVHRINVPQVGIPGQFTIMKVLGKPDTEWKELINDISKIKTITEYSEDFGRTFRSDLGLKPIQHILSNRIKIKYAEDGGADKDGVIELRRNVEDLDLGGSKYAQVRIGVDGTHYLKGMAMYSDDIPKGYDIVFNTNKTKDTPMLGSKDNTVLKNLKDDPDNPFGSTIKTNGQKGALNIVNEEGDWNTWSKTISSQILSKQTVPLAKKQLGLSLKQKQEEFEEIMALTNPLVKKHLLAAKGGFADDCDASAVHLKAAALPRQASKVILPIPNIKPGEIYAPSYKDGEVVVLIRHPHGGTFEIPQLRVNNRNLSAKNVMANAVDAVGIHPNVAKKLSGADFDGDTVIVIPNNKGLIRTSDSLKGLKNFDPIASYPAYPGMKPIKPQTKQTKMGEVSNLITDMTIKGASMDEIARAVRHSMVVIDSEKHNLNYKQSYEDNGIAALSAKYQNSKRGGASTLISKASSEKRVLQRKASYKIDPETGKRVYELTGATYKDVKVGRDPITGAKTYTYTGKIKPRLTKTTKMDDVDDAFTLSSGRPIEQVYAHYANELKSLANRARKESLSLKPIAYSASAKKAYEKEVATLNAKLNTALKNKPLERQAQVIANSIVKRKIEGNRNLDADDVKKIRNQALAEARVRTGAKKTQVTITNKEWDAIQSGAITSSKLTQILQNSDLDRVKQLATPKSTLSMTPSKIKRAESLLSSGYTQSEVAEALGVSVNTLGESLK